jgi:hypothetical protein
MNQPADFRGGPADYDAARTKTARGAVTTRSTEAVMQPTKDACACMHTATVSQARWRDSNNIRGGASDWNLSRKDYGRLLPLPLQDLLQAGM